MFHGHPAACFPSLRFSLSPSSQRKLKKLCCQLHSLTLCYRHHQPLVVAAAAAAAVVGGRQHTRQLFCLDDSIISFSGISISIIILIIAFDPRNYQTSLKLMTISLSASNSRAFKKNWKKKKGDLTSLCGAQSCYRAGGDEFVIPTIFSIKAF